MRKLWLVLGTVMALATASRADEGPLAGYNGSFFLRDPNDWFVLFPKGRLQVDLYAFPDRGNVPSTTVSNASNDPRPKTTIFVRRARAELQGTFAKHFDFQIAGEFATTPATGAYGTLTDCFVIVDYLDYFKFQAGQFDIPFTLENRTSDKFFDFMERSVAVRAFGVPSNKDAGAMAWGWLPRHVAYYSLGLFNGDGQSFKNQDNWPALIGRAFVSPLSAFAMGQRNRWMQDVWVGGSFWYQHNSNLGGPAAPNATGAAQNDVPGMTTQGGVSFFSTNYNAGNNTAGFAQRAHLVPQGDTLKWAVELNVPIKFIGVRVEAIGMSMDLAQYFDANTLSAQMLTQATRSKPFFGNGGPANLNGIGYYVQVFGWILGDVNFIETPGLELAPRLKKFAPAKEPKWGLMLTAKFEQTRFDVQRLQRTVDAAGNPVVDPGEGNYDLKTFEFGANAWMTKHVRLTANYVMNYIDGTSKNVKGNFYYQKAEHEVLFRMGINL
jgi:phosphate-selective porin OprO and OprP